MVHCVTKRSQIGDPATVFSAPMLDGRSHPRRSHVRSFLATGAQPRRWRAGAVIMGTLIGVSACASGDLPENAAFDGSWTVSELVLDGMPIDLGTTAMILEIDTSDGALRGDTGCHQIFGAYTLPSSQRMAENTSTPLPASFTVPGSTTGPCDPADQRRELALVEALEETSTVRPVDDTLEFTGPERRPGSEDQVPLTRLVLTPVG